MQTWRNSLQSNLSKTINIAGVTLARFLWAGPVAALYLGALYLWQPQPLPLLSLMSQPFLLLVFSGAVAQIVATSLLVLLFKRHNFVQGAGLAKSEAIIAGIMVMLG